MNVKLVGAREVAKKLGVSVFDVYYLARENKIGHVKVGNRTIRFTEDDVAEYLEAKNGKKE